MPSGSAVYWLMKTVPARKVTEYERSGELVLERHDAAGHAENRDEHAGNQGGPEMQ